MGGGRYEEVVVFFTLFDTFIAELESLLVGSGIDGVVDELVLAVVTERHGFGFI